MSEVDFDQDIPKGEEPPYADLKGEFPRKEYINVASTNLSARGLKENELTRISIWISLICHQANIL